MKVLNIKFTKHDLQIVFTNNLFLDLFSDSSIYESWTLTDEQSFTFISLPGGEYCIIDE